MKTHTRRDRRIVLRRGYCHVHRVLFHGWGECQLCRRERNRPVWGDVTRELSLRRTNAALLDACEQMLANIEHWLETGEPADAIESKRLYDLMKHAVRKARGE